MIYFVSDAACSSFTPHCWQQASEEVCVRVGSLLCVRRCVLWLILWLWWGTAVRCATATSANHFVSQQWWRKCICMFVTVFERKCALKYNWTHSFQIWQVCALAWKCHFCCYVHVKELATRLSVNLCLSLHSPLLQRLLALLPPPLLRLVIWCWNMYLRIFNKLCICYLLMALSTAEAGPPDSVTGRGRRANREK